MVSGARARRLVPGRIGHGSGHTVPHRHLADPSGTAHRQGTAGVPPQRGEQPVPVGGDPGLVERCERPLALGGGDVAFQEHVRQASDAIRAYPGHGRGARNGALEELPAGDGGTQRCLGPFDVEKVAVDDGDGPRALIQGGQRPGGGDALGETILLPDTVRPGIGIFPLAVIAGQAWLKMR